MTFFWTGPPTQGFRVLVQAPSLPVFINRVGGFGPTLQASEK